MTLYMDEVKYRITSFGDLTPQALDDMLVQLDNTPALTITVESENYIMKIQAK